MRLTKPAPFAPWRRSPLPVLTHTLARPRPILMLAALIAGMASPTAADQAVRVQGSTTFHSEIFVPYRLAIEQATGRPVTVIANKSSWGLLALVEGRVDLAMISAPLEAEIASARALKPEAAFDALQAFPIGTTRVAFAVHPSNGVRKLSLDTMKAILTGAITNWATVGGPDLPIKVVAVKEGGGTVVAVRSQMLGEAPFAAGAVRLENANHVLTVVVQEPGAIGITQLGLIKKLHVPEIATERAVVQPLSFVTAGPPSPAVLALINTVSSVVANAHD